MNNTGNPAGSPGPGEAEAGGKAWQHAGPGGGLKE